MRILLIHRSKFVARYFEGLLNRHNFKVELLTATSAQEALQTFAGAGVDIVLYESSQLVRESAAVLSRLKPAFPCSPVLAVDDGSGSGNPTLKEALRAGVDDYLPSPLAEEECLLRLKAVLNSRQEKKLEKLITAISTRFINLALHEIDRGIDEALAEIGRSVGADRSYLFLFFDNGRSADNTHEWCAPGVCSLKSLLQNVTSAVYPWAYQKISALENIYVPSVDDLPAEAGKEKALWQSRSIKSLIIVPMLYEKALVGFLGIESVREKKAWARADIDLLRVAGGVFAGALERKWTEEVLRESEERTRYIIKHNPQAIAVFDRELRYLMVSNRYLQDFRLPASIIGRFCREAAPEIYLHWQEVFVECLQGQVKQAAEELWQRSGGEREYLRWECRLWSYSSGEIGGIITYSEIITARKQMEFSLRQSEERYREILSSIEEGYYETDLDGNCTFCNEAASRILGYSREELIGMNLRQIYKDRSKIFSALEKVYRSGTPESRCDVEAICKDGRSIFMEISIGLMKNKENRVIGFRGVSRDVTDRKLFEEKLKYLSMHDQLTGLYNRAFFEEELRRLDRNGEYPITIISADLDGLKLINDTMGHKQGDELLKACAKVLKEPLRQDDAIARVGGDEFVVLLPRTDGTAGESVVHRIREAIDRYNRENPAFPLSISIGLATATGREHSLDEVFKKADNLMYRDKLYHSTSTRGQVVKTLMAALSERDYITQGHAVRLQALCRKMGQKIGLDSRRLADLMLLAQVHDLGKVGIPDHILFKKGALSEEEWEIMRQHPEKGYRIARSSPDLAPVADLILRHHERWDGTGYPLGLKGEDIPVECRILAIVDAFDAMTSERPYSKSKSREEAIAELRRCAGTQFDASLVEHFLNILSGNI